MAGPYVNLGIGTGFGTDVDGDVNGIDFDADARTTIGGGVGLGYDFGNIRLEGKVTRSTADVDSTPVKFVDPPHRVFPKLRNGFQGTSIRLR